MDICFIKPQDLLALSKAVFAWRFIKDKCPSRSAILDIYSVHWQEERGGEGALESNTLQAMSRDHDLANHQHAQAGSQKKGKENNSETQPSSTFHKGNILTSSTVDEG
jgi:hypothetical protein